MYVVVSPAFADPAEDSAQTYSRRLALKKRMPKQQAETQKRQLINRSNRVGR
jgi:hypothetical protein